MKPEITSKTGCYWCVASLKVLLLTFFFTIGCNEVYLPKPRSYYRIDMPQKEYATYESPYCPLKIEYPAYANVERDTTFFNDKPDHPCWLNIKMPYFNSTIHLSYKEIGSGKSSLDKLISDSYNIAFKHTVKADYIDENIVTQKNAYGVLYDIGGNTASSVQFFVTDSTQHFLRGSLYFKSEPNVDSLMPVINFIREDILHLMQTIEWK